VTGRMARGIDHVGLTVADIAAAERFLIDGLGAEFIYETLNRDLPPFKGPEVEKAIGIPPGCEVNVIRMYKMGVGPGIELFQYTLNDQRPAARACDIGWQHVALYVDDLEGAIDRAVAAGAQRLSSPWNLTRAEGGPGNKFCLLKAPFGAIVELITYPSLQPYENGTHLRRWKPPLEVE
jgi:catechol 2,3-dioxygenase-like lactoylglutathione lyase family enzyme